MIVGVDLQCAIEPHDRLVVHLREGDQKTNIAVSPAHAGASSLLRAVDAAINDGYGECFWPGDPGQYWWIFNRHAESIEVIAMWTRGGASLWEHVFRATDEASFVRDTLVAELERCDLRPADSQ